MKRYTTDLRVERHNEDTLSMIEFSEGQYVKLVEAQERENKLIDMIYKSNTRKGSNFCPEVLNMETDFKYKKENCSGDDVKCRECWRITINNELQKKGL